MRRALIAIALVAVVGCAPAAAPNAPPAPAAEKPAAPPAHPAFDGFTLGASLGDLYTRYGQPCDVDPIDGKSSTLTFWASGECNGKKPFSPGSTLVALTPYGEPAAEDPVDLVVWFGPYFDDRAAPAVKMNAARAVVDQTLGAPLHEQDVELRDGNGRQVDYPRDLHVLFVDGKVVGVALGRMTGGKERAETLSRGYAHHLRYLKK